MPEPTATDWDRQLRPLRPGDGPIGPQLALRRMALVVMTAIFAGVGLLILALFAGFGRPRIGLQVVALLVAAPTAWSWLDYSRLRGRVRAYLADHPGESA